MKKFPPKKELMDAILVVLQEKGTIMTTAEINAAVAKQLGLSEELLTMEDANCTGTEYSYRMRWARTELKQKGFISNIKRGLWNLN